MSSLKPLNYHNKSFKTPHQTFTNIIQLLNTSFNKKKKKKLNCISQPGIAAQLRLHRSNSVQVCCEWSKCSGDGDAQTILWSIATARAMRVSEDEETEADEPISAKGSVFLSIQSFSS